MDKDGVPDKYDKCPQVKGEDNGCPKSKQNTAYTADDLKSLKPVLIYFELSKAEINKDGKISLDNMANFIKKASFKKYLVSGHTDNTSSDQTNLKLSQERANTVKAYLVSKGVNPDVLVAKGFGEAYPVDTTNTEEGRQKNRRVEVIPVK